jgi:hypothetical protein
MHLNRTKCITTKLMSLFSGMALAVTGMNCLSTLVQADDQIPTSNLLVSATQVADNVSPQLELSNRNRNRLDRCDSGTIIIFDLRRCPLQFEQLPTRQQNRLIDQYGGNAESLYEIGVTQEIIAFMESCKGIFPGLEFALRGFPFVGGEQSRNSDYQGLIDTVNAFVPSVTTESEAVQAVGILAPLTNGRPIITGFDIDDSESQEVDPDSESTSQAYASFVEIAELVQDLSRGESIAMLQSSWGETSSPWDLNYDGSVSGIDLAILMNYFSVLSGQDESDSSDESDGSDSENGHNDDVDQGVGNGDNSETDSGTDSGNDGNESDDQNDESDDQDESTDIETITSGNGFSGVTGQPGLRGNPQSPGYGAKAIARWTELPYITRSEDFYVTVSAFHMADIKRVDFTLNGGATVKVHDVVPHPESGYPEYIVKIDVSTLTEGLHEVRAIAFPYHGEPRVLQGEYVSGDDLHDVNNGNCSFWFQYDPSPNVVTVGGSQGDFQTIDEAIQSVGPAIYGGRIELAPGTHHWLSQSHTNFENTANRQVLTISGANGTNPDDVILRSSGTSGSGRGMSVHIKNLTVLTEEATDESRYNIFQGTGSSGNRIFFENLIVTSIDDNFGWGLLNGHQRLAKPVTEWKLGCWVKDVNFMNIAKGINGVTLAKNINFFRLSADAFGASPGVIVNLHVDKADPYNANHIQHCDIVQFTSANGLNVENRIFADIKATNHYSQVGHFNGHPLKNFAFVRWSVDSMYSSQTLNWIVPFDHVVVDACTFRNSRIYFGSTVSHLLIRDTLMNKLAPSDMDHSATFQFSTSIFENFHVERSHGFSGAETGEVTFASPSAPAGSPSNGADGFIETILSGAGVMSNPFDGNMEVERRGDMTNHFYYEANALDLSWID